jgi:murein DD-endopeptidase MepM/ murein hydrolase activator NlpD
MVAVLAMAVVTSVPANAVLADATSVASVEAGSLPTQSISASTADLPSVQRDSYSVAAAPAAGAPAASGSGATTTAASAPSTPSSVVRYPFDGEIRVSDGFGPRESPCSGCSSFHLGTDFLPGEGNPVYAMADGVVQDIQYAGGLGVHVVINHWINGEFLTTTSAHMQEGSVAVSVGQTVHAGDLVGRVGNTGDSTGPHLHFELRLAGTEAVDAASWIPGHLS